MNIRKSYPSANCYEVALSNGFNSITWLLANNKLKTLLPLVEENKKCRKQIIS